MKKVIVNLEEMISEWSFWKDESNKGISMILDEFEKSDPHECIIVGERINDKGEGCIIFEKAYLPIDYLIKDHSKRDNDVLFYRFHVVVS